MGVCEIKKEYVSKLGQVASREQSRRLKQHISAIQLLSMVSSS